MYSLPQSAEYCLPYKITHIEENKWNGNVTYFPDIFHIFRIHNI